MELIERVRRFCDDEHLLHNGDTLVVGCSGGPDSLALLDILCRLRPYYGLTLIAVYVHHGLRDAADAEAEQVRQEAERRQCLFVLHRADIQALAAAARCSVETAGRNERYRVFRQIAAQYHARSIAVAHHQDDQAETVLLHLLRGTGLTGLGGMRPQTGDIIRPFLCVNRREIETYIADRGLLPCHDETNDETVFLRNRVRLDILPYLKQYNPAIADDLNRLAVLAQGDEDILSRMAQDWYHAQRNLPERGVSLPRRGLAVLPVGLLRRVLRYAVAEVTGTEANIPFHYIEALRALCTAVPGKQFHSGKWRACTDRDTIQLLRPQRPEPEVLLSPPVAVAAPGVYVLDAYILTIGEADTWPEAVPETVVLDGEKCSFPLCLRYRLPGDVIALPGGHRKLKKYYNDKKVPLSQRSGIPLLCTGSEVLYVYGYAVSQRAAATQKSRRYLAVTITRRSNHA